MKYVVYLLFLAPLALLAQDKGVHFVQDELSWQEVQAKAKAENKYIYVDVSIPGCEGCVYLDTKTFPLQEVGDFFNSHFICVKALMYGPKDALKIQSWSGDAMYIGAKYEVRAWPTSLFFSPDGKAVHKIIGGVDGKDLIEKAKNALDPSKQYYTLVERIGTGDNDPVLLHNAAIAAKDAGDDANGIIFAEKYVTTQKNIFTKDNLSFIGDYVDSSKGNIFNIFYHNSKKVDAVMGDGYARGKVKGVILVEEISPRIRKVADPNWMGIQDTVEQKYPGYGDETILKAKALYFNRKQDWTQFQQTAAIYMTKYGAHLSAGELRGYAWIVFLHCHGNSCILQAMEWSKKSIEKSKDQPQPAFMDTYAYFLYRVGKKDDAIALETKAVSLNHALQPTLDKMIKGEKTWND